MTDWPTGWREATLSQAGIVASPFALNILSAWNRSTPVTPHYNNPLGMPHKGFSAAPYLNTPYALFLSMPDFRAQFARFLSSNKGREVFHILNTGERYSDAWRAIHALSWPARATETDWPIVILDMVEDAYRQKLESRRRGSRKTAGVIQPNTELHDSVRRQAQALHMAAATFSDASKGIRFIVKGLQ